MVKREFVAGVLFLMAGPGQGAMAATCDLTHQLNQSQLQTLVGNKFVCLKIGAAIQNNEHHTGTSLQSSGNILEAGSPGTTIGSYSIHSFSSSDGYITYTYTGSPNYVDSFTVDNAASTSPYTFCELAPNTTTFTLVYVSSTSSCNGS